MSVQAASGDTEMENETTKFKIKEKKENAKQYTQKSELIVWNP